jgi:hypothetical protein
MTSPRRSTRITGLHSYHEAVRPCAPHRYSAPRGSAAWGSPFPERPRAATAPLAARGRGTTGSHVPHRSPDQARATSMPETTWAVDGYPPGSSRAIHADPVSISSRTFRHVISGSLALAFLAHTCRAHGATFPHTLTTTALDRSSLRWFTTSPRRAVAEDHRINRPLHLRCSTAPIKPIFYIRPPDRVSCSHHGSRSWSASGRAPAARAWWDGALCAVEPEASWRGREFLDCYPVHERLADDGPAVRVVPAPA